MTFQNLLNRIVSVCCLDFLRSSQETKTSYSKSESHQWKQHHVLNVRYSMRVFHIQLKAF